MAMMVQWLSLSLREPEASNVETLYRLAEQLPEPDGNQAQERTPSYAQVVVEEGWLLLAYGQASSYVQSTAEDLRGSIQQFEPQTIGEMALYTQMPNETRKMLSGRCARVLSGHSPPWNSQLCDDQKVSRPSEAEGIGKEDRRD
jgi:hypothetical protein